MGTSPDALTLRNLSLPTRLVLTVFLFAVGLGYFSALVQLHFQHATAGQLLPGKDEAVHNYHGHQGKSQLERLITADENKPFNGSGQMSVAFTTKAIGWKKDIKKVGENELVKRKIEVPDDKKDAVVKELGEKEVRKQRNLEVEAIVAWIHAGAHEKDYDSYELPVAIAKELGEEPNEQFFTKKDDKWTANIKEVVTARCARCHNGTKRDPAAQVDLNSFDELKTYIEVEDRGGGMSLPKLAQTTHVHLLGFSMLFGLTGVIFSLTSYPSLIRGIFAPWTLIFQVIDVSCWWLGRIDPMFAQAILVTGGMVGLGLIIHIFGSVFNMYGKAGRTVVLILILGAGAGGVLLNKHVIEPYMAHESISATIQKE